MAGDFSRIDTSLLEITFYHDVKDLLERQPYNWVVTEGSRQISRSNKLFIDYRLNRGPRAAPGGLSPHNYGYAIDVALDGDPIKPGVQMIWLTTHPAKHPDASSVLNIALISTGKNGVVNVSAAPDPAIYFVNNLTYAGADQSAGITVAYTGDSQTSGDGLVGVGVRWAEDTLDGYLLRFDLGDTFTMYKVVAGVYTQIGDPAQIGSVVLYNTGNALLKSDLYMEIRAIGSSIQGWVNGVRVITVTDTTFAAVGAPVIYAVNLSATDSYSFRAFTTGDVVLVDPTLGWYSQNGFERNRNIAIGTLSIAFSNPEQFTMDANEEYDQYTIVVQHNVAGPAVAIGYKAMAVVPKLTGTSAGFAQFYRGPISIGASSEAIGGGSISIGANANALGESQIAIGPDAGTVGDHDIAIGDQGYAEGLNIISIGYLSTAYGDGTIIIGKFGGTDVDTSHCIGIGQDVFLESNTIDGIAIGYGAYLTDGSEETTVIGKNSFSDVATGSIGIGTGVIVEDDFNIAVGYEATVNHANSIVLGYHAGSTLANQMMIGGDDATRFLKELVFNGGPGAGVRGPNVVIGTGALATTDTDGFLYIPTCAGVPTGVPTAYTGTVALVFDTTNNKLCVYDGGWLKTVALT